MQVHTFDTSTMMPFSVRFIGNCENIGISFLAKIRFVAATTAAAVVADVVVVVVVVVVL